MTEQKGFAQIFLLAGMLLIAVSLPIATKLVQQNQENRSNAASGYPAVACSSSNINAVTCFSSYKWKCAKTGEGMSGEGSYSWIKQNAACVGVIPVTKVTIQSSLGLYVGDSKKIPVTVYPSNATNKTVTWSSSNSATAKVSSSGEVTALRAGTAYITVRATNGVSSVVTVKVEDKTPVTGITLDPSTSFNLTVGETKKMGVKYTPSNATNKTVAWSVNNSAIATVTSDGVVKGIKAGTTTITAKSNGKLANVAVTVVAKKTVCSSNTCNSCTDKNSCTSKSLCVWDANKCRYKIEKITLDMTFVSIKPGETKQVTSIVTPNIGGIYCSSDDNSVATIENIGTNTCRIKGVKVGTAKVTISSKEDINVKGIVTVTVTNSTTIPVESISLSKSTLELEVNNSVSMGVNYQPDNANTGKSISSWSSDTPSVATVTSAGIIRGVKIGKAKITARTTNGKVATVEVTVIGTKTGTNCVSNTDCSTGYVCNGGVCVVAPTSNNGSNPFSSTACRAKGGMCATFTSVLKTGASCKVNGKEGKVETGYCPGDNKVVCCVGVTTVVKPSPGSGGSNPDPGTDPDPGTTVVATGITLAPTTLSLAVGSTGGTITAVVNPTDTSNQTLTWLSSNTAVADVEFLTYPASVDSTKPTGWMTHTVLITPKSVGTAVITAKTTNGKTATATVTVTGSGDVSLTSITPTSLSLTVGNTGVLNVVTNPADYFLDFGRVTWKSSNTAVATVADVPSPDMTSVAAGTGFVKAISPGTAVITAALSGSSDKTVSATVTVAAAGSAKISFKFSLRGVKPEATCIDELGNLTVDIINSSTVYQLGLSTDFEKVTGVGSSDSMGDQIFQVSSLPLDSKFASVGTDNRVKIKGPFHSKRRMCLDGQTAKLPETSVCNISLTSDTVYNFSGYKLLTGDIDRNGMINGVDYSIIKTSFNPGGEAECGRKGDLNLDGKINSADANLIKEALLSIDDE